MNGLKPITEHVCDMLRERSERGLAKYGTTIDRDDLSPAQWLQHLQEELLDAAQYVEALKRQSAPPASLLTNPYTGQPRDYRDVETDPAGVLIVEPGAPLKAAPRAAMAVPAPSAEDAQRMGEQGGPAVESERLAFEAWMRGHCWALGAVWNGKGYIGMNEEDGYVCPQATRTRGLWAAWRDRAALAPPAAVPALDWIASAKQIIDEFMQCQNVRRADGRLVSAARDLLAQAPPAAVQAWILRTGHGIGIHVGERPPVDCVGWKPLTAGDIKDAPPAECNECKATPCAVPALEVFRIAGGDTECCPDPTADEAADVIECGGCAPPVYAPPAAVPEGIDAQFAKVRAADELANAKRAVSRCITALLDIKVMIEEGDYDEAVSHIDALTEGAAARKGE